MHVAVGGHSRGPRRTVPAQYAVTSPDSAVPGHSALPNVQAVRSLKPGKPGTWLLSEADEPVAADSRATSMAELRAASARRLGAREFKLLGVSGPLIRKAAWGIRSRSWAY